jgi:uncharacterized protein (DUF2141 family)
MNLFSVLPLIYCLLGATEVSHSADYKDHRLEVRVKGASQTGKDLCVALYGKGDGFPSERSSLKNIVTTTQAGESVVLFEVPYGEYAVAVFVDGNGNGKLDKNIFGFPKEQFGFSNDFKPRMAAPKFEQCSFLFSEEQKQVTITLRK